MDDSMMRSKRNKRNILIVLVLIVLLGIGYAYLQTTLNINGTTNVRRNQWNIYWDNIDEQGSVEATSSAAIPTNDLTSISFSVTLAKPGDYYAFTVDAVNDGTLPAMVSNVSITIDGSDDIPDYLDVIFTYSNGIPIFEKQLLNQEDSEELYFRIGYSRNVDDEIIEEVSTTPFTVAVSVTYIQANGTAGAVVGPTVYGASSTPFVIGERVPVGEETQNNRPYAELLFFEGYTNFALKYIMSVDRIAVASIEFEYDNTTVDLRYGELYYESNKALLDNVFDSDDCYLDKSHYASDGYIYSCNGTNILAMITSSGNIAVATEDSEDVPSCFIGEGIAACEDGLEQD